MALEGSGTGHEESHVQPVCRVCGGQTRLLKLPAAPQLSMSILYRAVRFGEREKPVF